MHLFRQAEIENLGVAARGDENICGLDVAMDDALRVRGVERVGNLNSQVEDFFEQHGLAADAALQRLAVEYIP